MDANQPSDSPSGFRIPNLASPLLRREIVSPSRYHTTTVSRNHDGADNLFRPILLTNLCDMTLATMSTPTFAPPPVAGEATRSDMEVVELPLLLPRWQAQALEAAASRRGMTTGQILRKVIGDLFGNLPTNENER